MIGDEVKQYSQTLTDMGIDHTVVEHPELKIPPDVQEYLGLTLADGLATMIMKAGDKFIVVIRRCDSRVDSKKLKKLWMYPEKVAEVLRELDLYYKLYKNDWWKNADAIMR